MSNSLKQVQTAKDHFFIRSNFGEAINGVEGDWWELLGWGRGEAGRQQCGQGEFVNSDQYYQLDVVVKCMDSIR